MTNPTITTALRESAKQHRQRGDTGHAAMCEKAILVESPDLLRAAIDAEDFIERNLQYGQLDKEARVDLAEALKRLRLATVNLH